MDKKYIRLDNQKTYFKVFNIVCICLLVSVCILALFSKLLPKWFVNICFFIWLGFLVFYLIFDLIFYLKIKRNIKEAQKSKYLFDRKENIENFQTKFKDCIMQDVEFFENSFILNGLEILYDDVNLEFSIYGDNIMFHIYDKNEEVNPLLVFIVTKEMYYMIKKFNLNLEMLDNEIDMLNLNNN